MSAEPYLTACAFNRNDLTETLLSHHSLILLKYNVFHYTKISSLYYLTDLHKGEQNVRTETLS